CAASCGAAWSWGLLLMRILLAAFACSWCGRSIGSTRSAAARRLDVLGLHRLALVAPGRARVVDDRGDVGVGELFPRRHRRTGSAVQHGVDLVGRRTIHDLVAGERRECPGHTLAVGLVARSAVRHVDLLTHGRELAGIPLLVDVLACSRVLLLLLRRPRLVILRRLDLHHDRHEAMLLAAKLSALAAVDAHLLGLEPAV